MPLHHSLPLFSQSAAARLLLLDATFLPEAATAQGQFVEAAQSRLTDLVQHTEAEPPVDRTRALLSALAVPVPGSIRARPVAAYRLLPVLEQSDRFSFPVPQPRPALPKVLAAAPLRLPSVPTGSRDAAGVAAPVRGAYRLGLDPVTYMSIDGPFALCVDRLNELQLMRLSDGVCLSRHTFRKDVELSVVLLAGQTAFCGIRFGAIVTLRFTLPQREGDKVRWTEFCFPYASQIKPFEKSLHLSRLVANADYIATACAEHVEVICRTRRPGGRMRHSFGFRSHSGWLKGMCMTPKFLITWGGETGTCKVWQLDKAPSEKMARPAGSALQSNAHTAQMAQICGNHLMTLTLPCELRTFDLPDRLRGVLPPLGQPPRPYLPKSITKLSPVPMDPGDMVSCFAASELYVAVGTAQGVTLVYQNLPQGYSLVRTIKPKPPNRLGAQKLVFADPTTLVIQISPFGLMAGSEDDPERALVYHEHPAPQVICLPKFSQR
jgi:hypothetical protein